MLSVADDASVHRKSSIKAKLRSISINRHKGSATDEQPTKADTESGERRRSSALLHPDMQENSEVASRSRARSTGRTALMDNGHAERAVLEQSTTNAGTIATSQLAAPIMTPSVVKSLDQPSKSLTEETPEDIATGPVAILENVRERDTAEAAQAPAAAGGFLSTMLNAATNFSTVLGAGSPRTAVMKSPKTGNEPFQDSPSRQNTLQGEGTPIRKPDEGRNMAELSLKDMGLSSEQVVEDESRSRASSLTVPGQSTIAIDATDVKQDSRPNRSGSVATTQSRRRRGSTAVSVFSDGQAQKITGFAVASNKRNREFHATFRSVPDADYLLDDYGCALQKEILVHGRMYVSESHICFNSNIFGWVTNLVISFLDITSLEKKSTAGIFPNAIQISTQQAKHVFASFISRDTTFDLIVNIWRLTHPSTQTTAHGIEIADVDRDELYDSESDDSDESEDEDSIGQSAIESDADEDALVKQPSNVSRDSAPAAEMVSQSPPEDASGDTAVFPGPREHAPTEAPSLSDGTAFAKALIDECFSAPVGRIYDLLYGDDTSFMQDFLTTNQKLLEVQVGTFHEKAGKSVRSASYVKPLSGPIGPKQTRCLLEDVIEIKDFEKSVQIVQTTTSPDVPSGDAFAIKTRFSLMWGPRNTTRFVANCVIEWSKNSWIKGPIEKASNAGQVQFMADLSEALKNHLGNGAGAKKKGRKSKRARSDVEEVPSSATTVVASTSAPPEGAFGIVMGVLQNININALTLVLLIGMMFAMIRMQKTIRDLGQESTRGSSLSSYQWQRAETDLWDWLAERTLQTESGIHAEKHIGSKERMTRAQIREALAQARIQAAVLEDADALLAAKQEL